MACQHFLFFYLGALGGLGKKSRFQRPGNALIWKIHPLIQSQRRCGRYHWPMKSIQFLIGKFLKQKILNKLKNHVLDPFFWKF